MMLHMALGFAWGVATYLLLIDKAPCVALNFVVFLCLLAISISIFEGPVGLR